MVMGKVSIIKNDAMEAPELSMVDTSGLLGGLCDAHRNLGEVKDYLETMQSRTKVGGTLFGSGNVEGLSGFLGTTKENMREAEAVTKLLNDAKVLVVSSEEPGKNSIV